MALVVVDDQFTGDLVKQTLMMNGYDTVTCSNFKHTLKIYYKSQIHLLGTYIFMPGMDDIKGIQRLK